MLQNEQKILASMVVLSVRFSLGNYRCPFLLFIIACLLLEELYLTNSWNFEGSSYMVGRALTSLFWGHVADHYGRKPVIVIGTITVWVLPNLHSAADSLSEIIQGCFLPIHLIYTFFQQCWFVFLRVIFNTLFGLSVNYWMAILTRFLLGFTNGMLGPIKVPIVVLYA